MANRKVGINFRLFYYKNQNRKLGIVRNDFPTVDLSFKCQEIFIHPIEPS
jgi:hypothetical protein